MGSRAPLCASKLIGFKLKFLLGPGQNEGLIQLGGVFSARNIVEVGVRFRDVFLVYYCNYLFFPSYGPDFGSRYFIKNVS